MPAAPFLLRLELLIGFSQTFQLLHTIPVDWPAGIKLHQHWLGLLYKDVSHLPREIEIRLPFFMFLSSSMLLLMVRRHECL